LAEGAILKKSPKGAKSRLAHAFCATGGGIPDRREDMLTRLGLDRATEGRKIAPPFSQLKKQFRKELLPLNLLLTADHDVF